MKLSFEMQDLKRIVYWASCKFETDKSSHMTGQVEKRDLLGGFLDRWINRAPEFILFRHLLKRKKYEAISDFFFYNEESKKDAPDVLGLRDDKKLVKFVEYIDGSWTQISKMPWIEVKTVKKDQWLGAIGETQFECNHYYAIVESNINNDYLISIFEDSVFEDNIFKSFKMPESFIKSDKNKTIMFPKKIKKDTDLGFFRLIGIFKGDEIKKYSIPCKGRTQSKRAESPLYISNIEEIEPVELPVDEEFSEQIKSIEIKYSYQGKSKKAFTVPIGIDFLSKKSKVKVLKMIKSKIIIFVEGEVKIDNKIIKNGFYQINLKQFKRNSTSKEYIFSKAILEGFAEDCRKELLSKFDRTFK